MGHCPKGRLSFPIFTARFVLPRPSCKFLASLSYFARCYTSHFSNSASFFWDHHEILSSTIRALVVDLRERKVLSKIGVDINGHEVAVAPDHHLGYVPIYGNSGVGKPGTDGSTIEVVDLRRGGAVKIIDLGKPVRPHCAKFGPDGMLYVSAELSNALYVVDPKTEKVVGEIPTGAIESHMFVLSPDGRRAYTANVAAG